MDENKERERLLNAVTGGNSKLGDAIKSGSVDEVMKNLSEKDAQKLKSVLSDREATERLLKSEQAQKLMKLFLGEK